MAAVSATAHALVAQRPLRASRAQRRPIVAELQQPGGKGAPRGPMPPSAQAAHQQQAQAAAPTPQTAAPPASERPPVNREEMSRTVRAVILAGGETKNPLTRHRAMPAVPLGSSLLMVDVPLNNCLQAGINKMAAMLHPMHDFLAVGRWVFGCHAADTQLRAPAGPPSWNSRVAHRLLLTCHGERFFFPFPLSSRSYVLTQFQSHTLNSHIAASYPPLKFGAPDQQAWVDVLAAQQTVTEREWYLGSADAVRKNIGELKDEARGITPARDYVILSGAAVYDMDFQQMVAFHRAKNADVTIAMHTVPECDARSKGIAQVHSSSCKVLKFVEKPAADDLPSLRRDPSKEEPGSEFLANMGIYVFKREALFRLMDRPQLVHIGHHVIPNALAQEMKVYAFQHDGYWHDVSSLKDFFETNLDLADPDALMGMIDNMRARRATFLPPSIMHDVDLDRVIVGDGCVLNGCKISNSVLGQSMYVGRGTRIESSLLLGNGAWLSDSQRAEAIENGQRVYGIGENCFLRRCVVDENASIGNNVQIINKSGVKEADRAADSGFMIQDGIVVIMRNAEIPDGVVI